MTAIDLVGHHFGRLGVSDVCAHGFGDGSGASLIELTLEGRANKRVRNSRRRLLAWGRSGHLPAGPAAGWRLRLETGRALRCALPPVLSRQPKSTTGRRSATFPIGATQPSLNASTPKRWPGCRRCISISRTCSPTGSLSRSPQAGLWGPDDGRLSRPVLRAAGVRFPPPTHPPLELSVGGVPAVPERIIGALAARGSAPRLLR